MIYNNNNNKNLSSKICKVIVALAMKSPPFRIKTVKRHLKQTIKVKT